MLVFIFLLSNIPRIELPISPLKVELKNLWNSKSHMLFYTFFDNKLQLVIENTQNCQIENLMFFYWFYFIIFSCYFTVTDSQNNEYKNSLIFKSSNFNTNDSCDPYTCSNLISYLYDSNKVNII